MNPLHVLVHHFLNVNFDIILPSTSWSPTWSSAELLFSLLTSTSSYFITWPGQPQFYRILPKPAGILSIPRWASWGTIQTCSCSFEYWDKRKHLKVCICMILMLLPGNKGPRHWMHLSHSIPGTSLKCIHNYEEPGSCHVITYKHQPHKARKSKS